MGMKEPAHEPLGTIRNTVTQAKKTGDNAPVRNAGTQRKGGLNENKVVKNESAPAPKKG